MSSSSSRSSKVISNSPLLSKSMPNSRSEAKGSASVVLKSESMEGMRKALKLEEKSPNTRSDAGGSGDGSTAGIDAVIGEGF